MGESVGLSASAASRNTGNGLPHGAIHCTTKFSNVARVLWPRKTAANWAASAGVKERMAKYWLSGKHPVSASGKLALMRELD